MDSLSASESIALSSRQSNGFEKVAGAESNGFALISRHLFVHSAELLSLLLLYYYKSTNTDTSPAPSPSPSPSSTLPSPPQVGLSPRELARTSATFRL